MEQVQEATGLWGKALVATLPPGVCHHQHETRTSPSSPDALCLRAIQEIQLSDIVLTHRNGPCRVLAVHRRNYRGQIVGISRRGCDAVLWMGPQHHVATPLAPLPRFGAEVETARRLRAGATRSEGLLWNVLRHGRLRYRFRRQHVLGPFVADFYCPALRLVIEVDGGVHLGQRAEDEAREAFIRQHDIGFLRLSACEVERDATRAAGRVMTAVERREREICYGTRWVPACTLSVGDTVLRGDGGRVAAVAEVREASAEGILWDLAVAGAGSYVTHVCTVRGVRASAADDVLPMDCGDHAPSPDLERGPRG